MKDMEMEMDTLRIERGKPPSSTTYDVVSRWLRIVVLSHFSLPCQIASGVADLDLHSHVINGCVGIAVAKDVVT